MWTGKHSTTWLHHLLDLPGKSVLTRGLWIRYIARTLRGARVKILRHRAKEK